MVRKKRLGVKFVGVTLLAFLVVAPSKGSVGEPTSTEPAPAPELPTPANEAETNIEQLLKEAYATAMEGTFQDEARIFDSQTKLCGGTNYKAATDLFDKALSLVNQDTIGAVSARLKATVIADEAWWNYLRSHNLDEARRQLDPAATADPTDATPLVMLATVEFRLGKQSPESLDKAKALLDQAISLDATCADAYFMRWNIEAFQRRPDLYRPDVKAFIAHSDRMDLLFNGFNRNLEQGLISVAKKIDASSTQPSR